MLKSVKVLHTGDIHIGSVFTSVNKSDAHTRIIDHESNMLDIIKRASDYNLVLFAGDIFDTQGTDVYLADKLLSAVSEAGETHFLWACGNHDPYMSGIVQHCLKHKPDNLYIFPADFIDCVTFEEMKVRVYGRSFLNRNVEEGMLKNESFELDSDYINILCMHAEVTDSASVYNPVSHSDISKSGFDYVALGHKHTYSGLKFAGDVHYAYCGCIEGRGFDECGDKGFISARISKTTVQTEFISTCKRKYVSDTVDVTDISSYGDLISLIDDIIGVGNIGRIELIGINSISPFIDSEYIEHTSKAFFLECADKTVTGVLCNESGDCVTLRGMCIDEAIQLLEKESDNNNEIECIKKACAILLREFDKR